LVGDALGVPVEFEDRATVQADPVTDMRGFGTHNQPPGTWSDDGSLTLCTVDGLLNGEFDLEDMGKRFNQWLNQGLWTAWGKPFDVGIATRSALFHIADGTPAERAGGTDEYSNGNGSLMRILPVALRFANEPIESFANRLKRVSAITHAHPRSQMACVLCGLVIRHLLRDRTVQLALDCARMEFAELYEQSPGFHHFQHLLEDDFPSVPEPEIASTGYVLHTLHASLWCLLTTKDFRECVLKAVNLGDDTDTTGCVAGGLAGVAYGLKNIPFEWIRTIPRKGDVDCLFQKFVDMCMETKTRSVQ
jgi:ADP-ribosyl-[dinitrogen reductase] hydrolase